MKQASNLSWITIHPNDLVVLFNDRQLCTYLNKMIRKLDVLQYGQSSFKNEEDMKKFCDIFSNMEQLVCCINEPNDILVLLDRLVRLSTVNIYLPSIIDRDYLFALLEEQLRRLNGVFRVEGMETKAPKLFM